MTDDRRQDAIIDLCEHFQGLRGRPMTDSERGSFMDSFKGLGRSERPDKSGVWPSHQLLREAIERVCRDEDYPSVSHLLGRSTSPTMETQTSQRQGTELYDRVCQFLEGLGRRRLSGTKLERMEFRIDMERDQELVIQPGGGMDDDWSCIWHDPHEWVPEGYTRGAGLRFCGLRQVCLASAHRDLLEDMLTGDKGILATVVNPVDPNGKYRMLEKAAKLQEKGEIRGS